jgi:hypothetical protein
MLLVGISRAVLVSLIAAILLPLPGFGIEATAQQQDEPQSLIAPAPTPSKPSEYGAIAFTPDGSFFSVWKISSRVEAEDKVRTECSGLGRGSCEAVSFRGEICTAIATGNIGKERRITYAGGGLQPGDAEKIALGRCNADRRARGTCHLRTTVCGDGRRDSARAQ